MRRSRCPLAVLLFAGILTPCAAAATAANDSSYASPVLTASTGAAWSPPARVHAARPWESALRLPGRIVSLPFVALGALANGGLLFVQGRNEKPPRPGATGGSRTGGVGLAGIALGDRAGLGGELSWSPPGLGDRVLLQFSATPRQYQRERISAFMGPVGLIYNADWEPRELYFGRGLDATAAGRSNYALRSRDARLVLAWGWGRADSVKVRPSGPKMFDDGIRVRGPRHLTWVSAWAGPRKASMSIGRSPSAPSLQLVHPGEAAASLDRGVAHFAYGVGLARDARSGRPHWTSGWRASVEAQRFDRSLRALQPSGAQADARSFSRLLYRAEAGASVGRDPRTLRLAVLVVDQTVDAGGETFLLADLQALGGRAGLSGFEPGRFRDVDLALARLTYIFPLLKNLEFDVHGEAGGVYPGLSALRPGTLETSAGAALRIRNDRAMIGALGCDWSRETSRVWFAFGGVE